MHLQAIGLGGSSLRQQLRDVAHGTEVQKPIPSYQVYKGTVFELVDQAVDFVLPKTNLAVDRNVRAPKAPPIRLHPHYYAQGFVQAAQIAPSSG